jgi:hypothetical protein
MRCRVPGCKAEEHAPSRARRGLLQAGALGLLGTTLADLLALEAAAASSPIRNPQFAIRNRGIRNPKARSVVFIFQAGGPSQFETWDPKPEAPAEIRGEYRPIPTAVDGLQVCEYLPRLARRAGRFSIIKTLHHPASPEFRNEHNAAQYLLQTGSLELPPGENTNTIPVPRPRPFEWPSIGSMIAYAAPGAAGSGLPPSVMIPRGGGDGAGQRPGLLGTRYAPWTLDLAPVCRAPDPAGSCPNCFSHDDPNDPARAAGPGPKAWWNNGSCRDAEFRLPDLGVPAGLALDRLDQRRALLDRVERLRRDLDGSPSVEDLALYRRKAMELVLAQRGKSNPFDLKQEPDRVRELYGREEWGNAFLLARRLVEAGVRMVQINLRGWDTHQNAFRDLKGKLLPSLDRCLSGFLDDLHERGLLDETLVVMCGEMGRTPVTSPIAPGGINASGEVFTPGRHHWGAVFPCFFAGGGIRPGQVVGRTDPTGGYPDTEAWTPADLAATIFHLLGVGPEHEFTDPQGRPYRIYQGTPIRPLL